VKLRRFPFPVPGSWFRRSWFKRLALALSVLAVLGVLSVLLLIHLVPYPIESLDPNRSGPLILTDRNGVVLYAQPAPDGRRARWVALSDIPSIAVLTFLASEDQNFFEHGGVDPEGVVRAALLNLKERRIGYGGSTITMQLVRMIHAPTAARTWGFKLHQTVLALRLENQVDKQYILEQYLNRAAFGNGAVGFEAAAERYFGKSARSLSIGEATFLAVLPRAPTAYNPLRGTARALKRREHVFGLLVAHGFLSSEEAATAARQPLAIADYRPPYLAPEFIAYVKAELPAAVKTRGGIVKTTLDWTLQKRLAAATTDHVARLHDQGVQSASAVILDAQTSEILAMVGSGGPGTPVSDINMAAWRRHPGSALKPFVYALAIEDGDSPASIAMDIHDVPSAYRVTGTVEEAGPLRYREALAGSHNLAAVHVLERVGVDRFVSLLKTAGLGPLEQSPSHYGLRLALGSARVRLVDLAAAYGFLVKDGEVTPAASIQSITSIKGDIGEVVTRAPTRRLVSRETAWLVQDILADDQPRHARFGPELALDLPFPVAAKTGTARGFADTVAVATTREYTVAAWSGRVDGAPTQGLVAMDSAAPLVRAGMLLAANGRELSLPTAPETIRTEHVCADSGMPATALCPHQKLEYVSSDRAPRAPCTWHQHDESGRIVMTVPDIAKPWAERVKKRGGMAIEVATH
jgi:penicillin-binding protein 1C